MMKSTLVSRASLLFIFAAAAVAANNLNTVLARMDAAAPEFKSMTGRIHRVQFTAIVNDSSEESGTIWMLRTKGKDVRFLFEVTKPDAKGISFSGQKAEIYNPKMQTVEEYDLGKHKSLVDQFLLVGFGATGKELAKVYDLKYLGDETIAGQKTARIELTPKSAQARENFTKFELWISESGGYPVRQKLYEPSGNYWAVTYSDVKLNLDLKPDQLALKVPPGVKRVRPQH